MTDLEQPPLGPESISVQLTRVEGSINLMKYQFSELMEAVRRHDTELGSQRLEIQRMKDEMASAAAARIATAAALKEADELRRQQSVERWTPKQRLIAVIAAGCVVATTFLSAAGVAISIISN